MSHYENTDITDYVNINIDVCHFEAGLSTELQAPVDLGKLFTTINQKACLLRTSTDYMYPFTNLDNLGM